MEPIVQQPYNLFAQQKQQHYPSSQNQQQAVAPGNVQGATVQDFANGKAAANSQAGVANQPVTTPVTPVNTTATDSGKTMGIRSGEWDNEPMKRGGYTQPITSMDDLAKAMGYTSPAEEEKLRKASVANRRILAVADAMRHIGNIYNTVRYAPAQQFNQPVLEEQSRYERGKAMRDKANQVYISYQQQKAAQDAKQKQWEAEQKQKADQWNAAYKFNAAKAAAEMAEKQRQYNQTYNLNVRKADDAKADAEARRKIQDRHYRVSEGIAARNAKTAERRAAAYENYMSRYGTGGGRRGTTANGFVFSTKNGSVEIPKDYLTKNSINRNSIVTQMRNAGIVDDEWKRQYDVAKWTGNQDEMLDQAISDWLMTDDDAEQFVIDHLNGRRGGNATELTIGWGDDNGNSGKTIGW